MINDFLSTTPLSQTISSISNTQKIVTKSKIKSIQLWFSNLMYGFSCNVEILNNHHKTLLISWNSWIPIKLILVAKNEMIGDFLSTLESSDSSFTNHLINSKNLWASLQPKKTNIHYAINWSLHLIQSRFNEIRSMPNLLRHCNNQFHLISMMIRRANIKCNHSLSFRLFNACWA